MGNFVRLGKTQGILGLITTTRLEGGQPFRISDLHQI